MVISFLQILQESVKKLLPGGEKVAAGLPALAIAALAATVVIKGIIGIGCVRVKTTQVQALAQDCKTDVYFNTLSLLFPLIGYQIGIWWLDPVGAALLSLYVIYDWAETSFQNVIRLSGSAVDDRLLKKITFLAWRFAPIVKSYKTITAYHAGDGVWVEIDVMLDGKTPLEEAHDIAETLQYCCEGRPLLPHHIDRLLTHVQAWKKWIEPLCRWIVRQDICLFRIALTLRRYRRRTKRTRRCRKLIDWY